MRILFVSLICFALSPLFSQNDEYIAWNEIPDANGYLVEIRDESKKIILQKKVKKNILEIDIPKGKYEVRTAPLDVFGKPAVWSLWEPIKVIVSIPPALSEKSSSVQVRKDDKNAEISFSGKNFLEHIKVSVKNEKDKIPVSSVKVSEDGESVSFKLDLSNSKPGVYDLTLANPRKKNLEKKNFITINTATEKFSFKEYQALLANMKKSCPISEAPDMLVKSCFAEYIYLDVSNKDKEIAYNFLKAIGDNYHQRLSAYRYFSKNCDPPFRPISEFIEDKLSKKNFQTDSIEISSMERTLQILKNCPKKNP